MSRDELVATGKGWIEHAPPAGAIANGLRGWKGAVGYVCASCASRILRRGCKLQTLADSPVWDDTMEACDLCGFAVITPDALGKLIWESMDDQNTP